MVSSIITQPANGANIGVGQAFRVSVVTTNLQTGFFTAAQTEYYTQPQTLNSNGEIRGHQHITIQNLGDAKNPPDANQKNFFKGLNDGADPNGVVFADVPAGTLNTPGTYRICSMSSSFSHQPLIMPIAQRGSQDDCIRITVGGNGGGNRGGNGGKNGAQVAAATQAAPAAAPAAAAKPAATANNGGRTGGQTGRRRSGGRRSGLDPEEEAANRQSAH